MKTPLVLYAALIVYLEIAIFHFGRVLLKKKIVIGSRELTYNNSIVIGVLCLVLAVWTFFSIR